MRGKENGHFSSLLLRDCGVFLLDHAEAGDGEAELDFELVLGRSVVVELGGGGRTYGE